MSFLKWSMWSRRDECIAFKSSQSLWIEGCSDDQLRSFLVLLLLNMSVYVPLRILPFCALGGHGFLPLWRRRLVVGTPALHRCRRQSCCPPVFEHYLILCWLTPTDWLWIRQPPYPLVSAVKGQPWLRVIFFLKAFESNYNSLSLIKLVPPHHSVMFFLATSQLEELLVFVSPRKGTHHFAW